MSNEVELIKETVTKKKKLHLAKAEMYPQIQTLVDSSLETRGVTMAAALKHGCSEDELWRWIVSQIID